MIRRIWRKLRQQDRVEELERALFFSREECAMEQMYREQAERELKDYQACAYGMNEALRFYGHEAWRCFGREGEPYDEIIYDKGRLARLALEDLDKLIEGQGRALGEEEGS